MRISPDLMRRSDGAKSKWGRRLLLGKDSKSCPASSTDSRLATRCTTATSSDPSPTLSLVAGASRLPVRPSPAENGYAQSAPSGWTSVTAVIAGPTPTA